MVLLISLYRNNAEEALQKLNGTVIGKQTVRLSWGRNPANKQVHGRISPPTPSPFPPKGKKKWHHHSIFTASTFGFGKELFQGSNGQFRFHYAIRFHLNSEHIHCYLLSPEVYNDNLEWWIHRIQFRTGNAYSSSKTYLQWPAKTIDLFNFICP